MSTSSMRIVRLTLKDVNFKLKPGQLGALVGPTGAGKTTIASLIARFYEPTGGQVIIDGKDIRSYRIKSLRRQISFVLQESLLFHATIWENIAYGRPEASRQEIIEAAKLANADEFIVQLPEGYDTMVGERGVTLSGGQRQRIAIARAIATQQPHSNTGRTDFRSGCCFRRVGFRCAATVNGRQDLNSDCSSTRNDSEGRCDIRHRWRHHCSARHTRGVN